MDSRFHLGLGRVSEIFTGFGPFRVVSLGVCLGFSGVFAGICLRFSAVFRGSLGLKFTLQILKFSFFRKQATIWVRWEGGEVAPFWDGVGA